jgi:hypothetical protein
MAAATSNPALLACAAITFLTCFAYAPAITRPVFIVGIITDLLFLNLEVIDKDVVLYSMIFML